ncbi:phenylacetate--CoA ligase family protein [Magnetospirillum sp. SS-4]|uniref:phenylacetate--CoA ligase family protein n=1 Tax=Magnetospirillum sp. SS-4 TaxID=2681465 RepID=UPI00137DF4FF|nr:AMP-binding protein [Magnetospirillum sp. SS-4]CAA7619221.1 Coenzyme F390 synthetase [Magnetospirillum sp. SS-4]
MAEFYDSLEVRSADERETSLFAALPEQVALAKADSPAFAASLAGIDPETVVDRAALARLPVLRKSDLIERQQADPPFASLISVPRSELRRVFVSPGPIYDPEGWDNDWWRIARALFAAGFRRGELMHNCFSYHFTPGGVMFETAAHALGCPVFPAGTGNTESQARAVADLRPDGYGGTPSFLKIILEKAEEMGLDHSSLTKACVSGEALPPALRQGLKDLGVEVTQCYASADLGLIAYESAAREGLIVDEGVIVEIVRPGTDDPVGLGEVGEVVVTTFNPDYPLIRFATGDLSAVMPGQSPCGRTNMRLRGWMGRADQTTKVKGMFIHPRQIAEVVRRHPELIRARLVVDRAGDSDALTLAVESGQDGEALASAIRQSFQTLCKLRAEVTFTPPGTLPNDGIVIQDKRA